MILHTNKTHSIVLLGLLFHCPIFLAMDQPIKTRTYLSHKLWRDKSIEMSEAQGACVNYFILDDIRFGQELRNKLIEEAEEVVATITTEELIAELADVMDVIEALCTFHAIDPSQVTAMQKQKHEQRGGYSKRIFVETVTHVQGSEMDQYCLAQPHKYPIIK